MVNAIEDTDPLLLASTGLHLWEEQGWLFLPISRSLSTRKLSLSGNDSNSVSLKGRKIPMGLTVLLILTLHYVSFQVCTKTESTVKRQYQSVTTDRCCLPCCNFTHKTMVFWH